MQVPSSDFQGQPLLLDAQQLEDLNKLNELRDNIEHVKPVSWFLEVAGLPRICHAAAYALEYLYDLPPVLIHLNETELAKGKKAIENIMKFDAAGLSQATQALPHRLTD